MIINGHDIKVDIAAYDGCHKIYIPVEGQEKLFIESMESKGWIPEEDIFKIDDRPDMMTEMYVNACSLRFIEQIDCSGDEDTFVSIIPQNAFCDDQGYFDDIAARATFSKTTKTRKNNYDDYIDFNDGYAIRKVFGFGNVLFGENNVFNTKAEAKKASNGLVVLTGYVVIDTNTGQLAKGCKKWNNELYGAMREYSDLRYQMQATTTRGNEMHKRAMEDLMFLDVLAINRFYMSRSVDAPNNIRQTIVDMETDKACTKCGQLVFYSWKSGFDYYCDMCGKHYHEWEL